MCYKRVAILGVDGAGNFFARTETPHMDRIFQNGAVTYDALTSIPTISAECWGSMLLGIPPEQHGLTNEVVSTQPYACAAYPTVFRVAREAFPQAELASFCNWNPINSGIIEENIAVHKESAAQDALLCENICSYLETHDPTLLFVQFDEVDGAGHKFGYGARLYLDKITQTDALLGRIYDTYARRGYLEQTLFIISADHGGNTQHGHGGDTDAEKLIFIGFAGKTVQKCELKGVQVRDIAAVTAAALGLTPPPAWTANIPNGIFIE